MELLMIFFTLLVIGLLCLLFKTTRLVGVAGLALLMLMFPLAFIALLVIACLVVYLNLKSRWRKLNVYAQPKLPD